MRGMAIPLLALRDVSLADGPRFLFEHADLALEPGARACLVGRNGLGKSTLLRLLAGSIEPDAGDRIAKAGLRIAFVPQEPAVEAATLGDFGLRSGAASHAVDESLEAFGLDPLAIGSDLSGGERRRAALAAGFAADPDVLLLDEPTNHLDIPAIQKLEDRLARSRAAVLIVSHDRAFLNRVTTGCFWLEERRVRRLHRGFAAFEAWAERIVEDRREEARRLDTALAKDERWLARGVTGRRARNEGRRRRLLALRAQKVEALRLARRDFELGVGKGLLSGRLVIEAKGVSKGFPGRQLVTALSTRILRGDRLAILGANGAGKSTLVRLLVGEAEPDEGAVRRGANLQIAYIDQQRALLEPGTSLIEFLAPGGGDQIMVGGAPRHVKAYAKDFLFREEQLGQPVESLSGGERNRLLLARVLARPSNVLVLDEPTNDLDMETLDVLEESLALYEGTVVLVSHDRDFVDRIATSTIALDGRGGWVETPGGWADFISQNPGFFERESGPAPLKLPPRPRQTPRTREKLNFKETRRLAELEAALTDLPQHIAAAERRLADPELYLRDPGGFDFATKNLRRLVSELADAEEEWLVLEEHRERLEKARHNPGG